MTKKLIISVAVATLAISMPIATMAHAATTSPAKPNPTAAIQCVGKAVAIRETGFEEGEVSYQSAITSAYATRAKSLAEAYGTGTSAGVSSGIKSAWSTFTTSSNAAATAWSKKRLALWSTFKIAGTACKAPAGTLD